MFATVSVNVAPSTLLALMDRLRETGSPADPAEAVDAAIRHWLATSPGTPPVEPRGYRAVSPNQFASAYADSVRNAWQDISLRMPGEKNWKRADLRRKELARATTTVIAVAPAATSPREPTTEARAADNAPPPTIRNTAPGQGWTEPERRKYRFRIEDVAFD
jgi:hypothetical protein